MVSAVTPGARVSTSAVPPVVDPGEAEPSDDDLHATSNKMGTTARTRYLRTGSASGADGFGICHRAVTSSSLTDNYILMLALSVTAVTCIPSSVDWRVGPDGDDLVRHPVCPPVLAGTDLVQFVGAGE